MTPYLGQLVIAIFFMIVAAGATASFAKLLQPVLDKAMIGVQNDPSTIHVIIPLAGFIFLSFVVRGLANYIQTIKMIKIGQSMMADIQNDIFSHFMALDLQFFHTHHSGDLVSRVTNDVNVMRAAVSDTLTGIGSNVFTLIFLVAVMFMQDWQLSLLSMTIFPFAAGLVAHLGKKMRKVSKSVLSSNAHLVGVLSGIFQGIRQVMAYGKEEQEKIRARAAVNAVRELNIKSLKVANLSTPINEVLVGGVVFGLIVYGGYRIADGNLTPGGLMSFIAAFSLAYEPMKKLARLNANLQFGLGAAERVQDMLAQRANVTEKPDAKELSVTLPDIRFEDIGFSYQAEGSNIRAVDKVTITAEAGKVTALVGASGSGKTSLLSLVLRFYDPQQGRILVEGQDIRDVTFASLRKHMALVSQDITIFDDTVAGNIAYGLPSATDEQIHDAARMAAAEDFILKMPEGYQTRVGENGVMLSGGQRQRISLARAILRNAPILLLDEATSALDNESERLIQQTLEKLQQGRTTLVIAHRLSTIQHAAKIIVMDKGQIIEVGTHAELLPKGGAYTRMYNAAMIA